ncbi:LuxR C-terminal-related transcriptional regulator [Prosthecomicrobium pneumaticum]|uniref:LuxR family maltose regulon positive regulatory protein n=1 Tax=Prosthecomicrobium pneumaticum TaxID=81895 RepID=A0A7W9L2W9_9HYPH|nr:LuxR family maltose regulon positive regulatory protein [Prosthecomicrobium pneumaticum]
MSIHPFVDRIGLPDRRFSVPRRGFEPIERPALVERILAGLAGQVVVLKAPPGFGKSELLAAAAAQLGGPGDRVAWLTLSAEDREPERFLDHLAAAFGLDTAPAQRLGAERARQLLLARLAAEGGRLILMLDGFEAATGEAFAACADALFRALPDNLRVVVATHRRPDLPLSRLRLKGLVTEILADELAFTRAEMKQLVGRRLSADAFEAFAALTGGWPALVGLALPLLADPQQGEARAALLAGTHRLWRDFVVEEVVPHLPTDMGEALTVCSILTEFPLDLAAHLSGVAVGPRSLGDLEDFAPIIVPVAGQPGWLRLHPVLRATFAAQLGLLPAERVDGLHARAAGWFAARGHLEKAVSHASRGGDFALAAEAIRQAGGVSLFIRAGHTVLARLIENIPTDVIYRSPSLMLSYALVLAKQGRVQMARELILELRKGGEPSPFPAIPLSALDHIEGLIDIHNDRTPGAGEIAWLEAMAQRMGPGETWSRGWIYNHLCIAYTVHGDLEAARTNALKSLTCYREEKASYGQIFMLIHLGLVAILSGRLNTAVLFGEEAEDLCRRHQGTDRNLVAIAHIPLAEALYHQGDLAAAERLMGEGMPHLARGEGWVDLFVRGYGVLARCRLAAAGIEAALAVTDRAEEVAVERSLPRLRLAVEVLRIELLTRAGLIDSALHLAAHLPPIEDEAAWPSWREWSDAAVALARIKVRAGRAEEAASLLDRLAETSRRHGRGFHLLLGTVVAVEADWAAERLDAARAALQRAIALAQPQDALQVFLDEGAPLAQAVRGIVRRFGLSAFSPRTAEFIGRIAGAAQHCGPTRPAGGRGEILSERENEVLELLARDATNKEIARDLGVSEATVKFHLKNLYAKLGVSRRSLAIAVARRTGMLRAG